MADRSPLGTFLRSRRERLSPAEVGLADGPRRRTPGLRREELAMLASISVDYLVRLEQGREQSPSAGVLAALSDALRLDPDERRHLGSMVAATTRPEMCPTPVAPTPLSDTTLAVLEELRSPAVVVDAGTDQLAWNAAYEALMRPTGVLDLEPPNLLRFVFAEPASRSLYRDWGTVARELVSGLRASTYKCTVGPALEALIDELVERSPEFARLWARHDVAERRRGVDRLRHPIAGRVELAFEALQLADPPVRHLVTYHPADAASEAALDRVLRAGAGTGLKVLHGGAA